MNKHVYEVTHSPSDTPGVWKVFLMSKESALFNHWGYVYADEAGLFSMSIYPTEEDAATELFKYNEELTKWGQDPSEHEF